jgi:hypothetical protein
MAADLLKLARQCCTDVGLNPSRDAEQVIDGLSMEAEDWPACCDSGCSPCVDTLQSAVRLLRIRLGSAGTE